MKKGFTLIEMLGVIAVLAVILLVTFPALSKSLKTAKQNEDKNFTNNLKVSAEAYIEINRDNYPELKTANSEITITIQQLYDSNLMKQQYKNVNINDTVKIVVQSDLSLKYYYKENEIGYGT